VAHRLGAAVDPGEEGIDHLRDAERRFFGLKASECELPETAHPAGFEPATVGLEIRHSTLSQRAKREKRGKNHIMIRMNRTSLVRVWFEMSTVVGQNFQTTPTGFEPVTCGLEGRCSSN
jgi:hypothetical protein